MWFVERRAARLRASESRATSATIPTLAPGEQRHDHLGHADGSRLLALLEPRAARSRTATRARSATSVAARLNGPIVASAATPTGLGYYMVGSDGGVFAFGDAKFHGSMGGVRLNRPVVGIAPTPDNSGYWFVASDGGVFAFCGAVPRSLGSVQLNQPVNGLVAYGNGYLMVASDGGVFDFSNRKFLGSLADRTAGGADRRASRAFTT